MSSVHLNPHFLNEILNIYGLSLALIHKMKYKSPNNLNPHVLWSLLITCATFHDSFFIGGQLRMDVWSRSWWSQKLPAPDVFQTWPHCLCPLSRGGLYTWGWPPPPWRPSRVQSDNVKQVHLYFNLSPKLVIFSENRKCYSGPKMQNRLLICLWKGCSQTGFPVSNGHHGHHVHHGYHGDHGHLVIMLIMVMSVLSC